MMGLCAVSQLQQVNSMNLNTGAVMPMIGLGVGQKNDRVIDAILNAIKVSHVRNLHEKRLLMRKDSCVPPCKSL